MINIGIRYFDEKNEGIILAGDKGVPSPVGGGNLILECDTFRKMGEFPIVFAPTGPSKDSAIISNFGKKILHFLYEKYKPDKFSVFKFTDEFPEFHRRITEIMESYYTEAELTGKKFKEVKCDFDFILAGSDKNGDAFLYYSRIGEEISIADVKFAPGYVTSLLGASEGMAFLKEILQDRSIPDRVAVETCISMLEMLRKIKSDMSSKYQLLYLENGEVKELRDEIVEKIRGLMDYRWNALWIALKNALNNPAYLDYVLKKMGG